MADTSLRDRLALGRPLIGPLLQEVPDSPDLVEFAGRAGFDFVIVDGEHAGSSVASARHMARAAAAVGIHTLARVPSVDPGTILALLDSGVEGVILAHCNSADDAERLVRSAKFPPRGIRGAANGSRAAMYGYGLSAREKLDNADRNTMCFGLIEEPAAVDEVESMLAVEGFDGCFIGAGDMSLSMGRDYYGRVPAHPEVQALLDRTRDETLRAGKYVLETAGTGSGAQELISRGVQLVVVQLGQVLRSAFDAYLTQARL
jgi:4-hydroxy-2-oxoheptanedioate aldolase